jgi:RNA polymerase sigma-70 factor (ECF subfamily)
MPRVEKSLRGPEVQGFRDSWHDSVMSVLSTTAGCYCSQGGLGLGYSPLLNMVLEGNRGHDQALEQLRPRLVAWAASRLPREDAEDLAQEALVLLVTKYAGAPLEELLPIAIGIAWKLRAARWRKIRRRGEDTALDAAALPLPDSDPDPEQLAARDELTLRLRGAIRQLTGRCRELMRLKLEERSFPEIAAILGTKINTIYSWDHRCLARLRELLGGIWERAT